MQTPGAPDQGQLQLTPSLTAEVANQPRAATLSPPLTRPAANLAPELSERGGYPPNPAEVRTPLSERGGCPHGPLLPLTSQGRQRRAGLSAAFAAPTAAVATFSAITEREDSLREQAMAALASLGALALLLLSGLSCCSAEACVEPQITPSYYTTSDAVISTETVFIVEISLTCKNRVQNMALYADVSGKQFPVTRGQDVGRYQVSWSLDHKSAHAGTYEVRFFDEESYSLLRKAQRNNEDVSVIPPLFTVSVDHRGTWNGPWVSTEVLAAAIGLVIYYLAFSAKSHIQA